ncbi:Dolichyl-diphosphooligosaccharide--protein glycosyltransferase subunit WBP1 [Dactylonectria macrodidyma]|uniref:Dolichyl-diphosphooligosaccharide--protein glycosyltransferase subunit WBP1 n=1 Tax=Dactylonectria macrodidyma TaxID=307937 RepID=A0A9P9FG33_9HYPO|nr:Dolichyl-diphosphooligosaccharide--protein glycosyltransferase subunit WBP1 [Dactylonectria macrodidyma]
MRSFASLVLLLFVALVSATSSVGSRLLVVLDNVEDKEAYSLFFGDLVERGYEITYDSPKSEGLSLFEHGERNYDHLIFLPSKIKGLGPNLTPKILVDFINAEGNILLTMSSTHSVPSSLTALLAELDISIPAERTGSVVDHFYYDTISAAESHDVLVLNSAPNVRSGLKTYFEIPGAALTVPHAIGHTLGSGPLLTPILRAPATAYSYNPKEQGDVVDPEDLFAAGQQLAIVSVMQALNSARFTIVGSAEMLQDKWHEKKVARPQEAAQFTSNREFITTLSAWTFKELGVLRVNSIEHHLDGDDEINPDIYRVKNDVSYKISVSEYAWKRWVPFQVPEGDALQLEFSMLSPFERRDLVATSETIRETIFATNFTLPDQHGIFNFKINYKRPFLTHLEEKNTVSVRHMAHDEWPRSYSISGAWPWLSGIGATVVGFVAFSALWMYSQPVKTPAGTKKTQ